MLYLIWKGFVVEITIKHTHFIRNSISKSVYFFLSFIFGKSPKYSCQYSLPIHFVMYSHRCCLKSLLGKYSVREYRSFGVRAGLAVVPEGLSFCSAVEYILLLMKCNILYVLIVCTVLILESQCK